MGRRVRRELRLLGAVPMFIVLYVTATVAYNLWLWMRR